MVQDKSNLKVVENLPANAGDERDMGSIPGLGRSPGGGNGNAFLENSMDRGAWWTTVQGSQRVGCDWTTPMQPHSHHRSPGSLLRDTCLQFNMCPLYAFLCSYKPSHICISFSVSWISTYSTHFLNLVFQNLHLANHSVWMHRGTISLGSVIFACTVVFVFNAS